MATDRIADDETMQKNLTRFDFAKEMMRSEQERPWARCHFVRTLFKNQDFRMVLISIDKGSSLREYQADATISVQVLKGSIRFTSQGDEYSLQPNSILMLGPSLEYEVEALRDSAFLLTIA